MSEKTKILLLGLGSEILQDDGIGPKIIKDLKAHFTSKAFTFKTSSLGGLDIIDLLKGFDIVIIIDGVKTFNGKIGDVYFMNSDKYMNTLHISNVHDVSFSDALKLAEKIGEPVPSEINIIGVEIKEDTVFGDNLSDELQDKYVDVQNAIHQYVKNLYNQMLVDHKV